MADLDGFVTASWNHPFSWFGLFFCKQHSIFIAPFLNRQFLLLMSFLVQFSHSLNFFFEFQNSSYDLMHLSFLFYSSIMAHVGTHKFDIQKYLAPNFFLIFTVLGKISRPITQFELFVRFWIFMNLYLKHIPGLLYLTRAKGSKSFFGEYGFKTFLESLFLYFIALQSHSGVYIEHLAQNWPLKATLSILSNWYLWTFPSLDL